MIEDFSIAPSEKTYAEAQAPCSDAIRARQLVLAEEFSALCKVKGHDLEAEGRLFTPEVKVNEVEQLWHEKRPAIYKNPDEVPTLDASPVHKDEVQMLSLREQTERGIFLPIRKGTNGGLNIYHLKQHDPAIMRMVEGVIREYVLCHHWDTLVKKISPDEYEVKGNKKNGGPLTQSVEKVRAKIASHYVQCLQERGYTAEDSVQIVGHAIQAYMRLTDFAKWQDVTSIKPLKDSRVPKEMIIKIHEHDRLVDPGFRSIK